MKNCGKIKKISTVIITKLIFVFVLLVNLISADNRLNEYIIQKSNRSDRSDESKVAFIDSPVTNETEIQLESPYISVEKVLKKLEEDFDSNTPPNEENDLDSMKYEETTTLTFTNLTDEEKSIYIAILAVPVLMILILCFCCCLCVRICLCPGLDEPSYRNVSSTSYYYHMRARNRKQYETIL